MLEKDPRKLKLADLEKLYEEGEQCDRRLFSEMRTNLQLVAGEHYVREGSKYWNRIRDNKQLTDEQRLKLTKNHTQRIMKIYENAILANSPGVAVEPKDPKSLQHQKSAELHYAIVQDWNDTSNFEERKEEWCRNFFEIGEVAVKIYHEPNDGHIMGYAAKGDENEDLNPLESVEDDDEGETHSNYPNMLNASDHTQSEEGSEDNYGEDGQEIDESKPIYSGKMMFKTVYAYNLKRDPDVGDMNDSSYIITSEMTSLSSIRARLSQENYNKLKQSTSYEYTIFDNNTGSYRNTRNQVLIKEIYFRPNPQIPNGYFYIWNTHQIMNEGELPYGIFPIVWEACEKQTGNARGHSIIRTIRPCQIELNRCASKVAEHQITVGDDKIFLNSSQKINQGAMLPGIRVNTISGGQAPTIIPGRSGDQFLPYMAATIDEMYKLAELDEVVKDVDPQTDIYSLLYRNLRYKKKFTYYSDRFERFLCHVVETGLKLAKNCVPEEALIPAIGKNEYINVSEFKNSDDLCHRVRVQARADDIESQMGKQLVLNHFLQYAGSNISRQDIGMAMRVSPFLNKEEMFKDFTLDYDNVTNDILALDRGQWRPPKPSDDPTYVLKKLSSRMAQEDFNLLPPQVQQMYQQKIQLTEQIKVKQAQDLKAAESGFIPSGGYLVAMDYYITPGDDPNKTRRVRVPSESVAWLLDKLQKQGNMMKDLTESNPGVQNDLAGMLTAGKPPMPGGSGPMPPRPSMGPMPGVPGRGMNGTGQIGNRGAAAPFRFPG